MEMIDTQSRIAVLENKVQFVVDELKEIRAEQKEQHRCLMEKFDSISNRIYVLEKWRFMIFGGAVVIGYILAHVKLDKLF